MFKLRELTLTFCSPWLNVVSPRIRSAVLSTIILITSAIKYHSTYYKCHFPFIFLGTATFNLTFFYRFFYFFCLLTSFVLASDILFRDRFLVYVAYSHVVLQTFLSHAFIFFRGIHLLATDSQFAGFFSGLTYMCRGSLVSESVAHLVASIDNSPGTHSRHELMVRAVVPV